MAGGRPRKEIDKTEFEKLCALQCTYTEICAWFDVTDKTLNTWCHREYGKSFSEIFAVKREKGKTSLRRYQFQLAQKNASMAIFLGKNYLGQTDVIEQNVNVVSDDMREQVKMLIDGIDERTGDQNTETDPV